MIELVGQVMGIGCIIAVLFVMLRVVGERVNSKALKIIGSTLAIITMVLTMVAMVYFGGVKDFIFEENKTESLASSVQENKDKTKGSTNKSSVITIKETEISVEITHMETVYNSDSNNMDKIIYFKNDIDSGSLIVTDGEYAKLRLGETIKLVKCEEIGADYNKINFKLPDK